MSFLSCRVGGLDVVENLSLLLDLEVLAHVSLQVGASQGTLSRQAFPPQ
jgi:hypothetical protein